MRNAPQAEGFGPTVARSLAPGWFTDGSSRRVRRTWSVALLTVGLLGTLGVEGPDWPLPAAWASPQPPVIAPQPQPQPRLVPAAASPAPTASSAATPTPATRPPAPVPPIQYLQAGARLYNSGQFWKSSRYLQAAHDYRDQLNPEEQVMLDAYLKAIRQVPRDLLAPPAQVAATPTPPSSPTAITATPISPAHTTPPTTPTGNAVPILAPAPMTHPGRPAGAVSSVVSLETSTPSVSSSTTTRAVLPILSPAPLVRRDPATTPAGVEDASPAANPSQPVLIPTSPEGLPTFEPIPGNATLIPPQATAPVPAAKLVDEARVVEEGEMAEANHLANAKEKEQSESDHHPSPSLDPSNLNILAPLEQSPSVGDLDSSDPKARPRLDNDQPRGTGTNDELAMHKGVSEVVAAADTDEAADVEPSTSHPPIPSRSLPALDTPPSDSALIPVGASLSEDSPANPTPAAGEDHASSMPTSAPAPTPAPFPATPPAPPSDNAQGRPLNVAMPEPPTPTPGHTPIGMAPSTSTPAVLDPGLIPIPPLDPTSPSVAQPAPLPPPTLASERDPAWTSADEPVANSSVPASPLFPSPPTAIDSVVIDRSSRERPLTRWWKSQALGDKVHNLSERIKSLVTGTSRPVDPARQVYAYSPDQSLLVGGTHTNGELTVWNVATRQAVALLPGAPWAREAGAATKIVFSPDGRQVAAVTPQGIVVHDLTTPGRHWGLRIPATDLSFAPESGTLAITQPNGDIVYCQSQDGRVVAILTPGNQSTLRPIGN
ncbi:hypothetical protein Isop_2622 [Isosphaera pallida ATCC 43644]|uniref:WD40 repeat, subgroup n=1 Tax=Isosphaera pallida (strain ATCC 43644 / DSM 9630 / IS1B) TaxID=575540 RepID=E8QZ50_ISOPI|nr:hypothetical protein [Isosphaera pallida]ADV63192.1 hypothetical protein Isop_2622 [Isosphaera pallida ATCC 43644]